MPSIPFSLDERGYDHPLEPLQTLLDPQPTDPHHKILTQAPDDNSPPYIIDLRSLYRHPITGIGFDPSYTEAIQPDTVDFLTRTLFLGEYDSSSTQASLVHAALKNRDDSPVDPYVLSYAPFYFISDPKAATRTGDQTHELRALPLLRPNMDPKFFDDPRILDPASRPRILPTVYLALWLSRASVTDKRTPGWRRATRMTRTKFKLRPFTPEEQARFLERTKLRKQAAADFLQRHRSPHHNPNPTHPANPLAPTPFQPILPAADAQTEDLLTVAFTQPKSTRNRRGSKGDSSRNPFVLLRDDDILDPASTANRSVRSVAISQPIDPTLPTDSIEEDANALVYQMLFEPDRVASFNYRAGSIPTDPHRSTQRAIAAESSYFPSPLPRPSGEETEQGFIGFVALPPQVEHYFARFDIETPIRASRPTRRQFKRDPRPSEEQNGSRPADTHIVVAPSGVVRLYPSLAHLGHITPPGTPFMSRAMNIRTLSLSSSTSLIITLSLDPDPHRSARISGNRQFGTTTLPEHLRSRFAGHNFFLQETPSLSPPNPEQTNPKYASGPTLTFCFESAAADAPPTVRDGLVVLSDD